MPLVGPKLERLLPDQGVKVEGAVEMREKGTATRWLPA
jgi:hypothetical protein